MPKLSRILTAVAALLLLSVYAFPLWHIGLKAPQYPEGLGMYIGVDTIAGVDEFDLTKINNLNHYIGMRPIEADAIPELRFIPWIVAGLIAAGLVVAALGRRRALYAWLAALVLLGAAGFADFYRWGYDYGHNLDAATAIIKIPGMSYQPPLIGTKHLLNFTATSWPALGGWLAMLAGLLGAAAALLAYRAAPARRRVGAAAAAAVVLASCAGGHDARPIAYDGTESCDYCRMAITDPRFGAELVMTTGKVHRFDSVECVAAFYAQARAAGKVASVWVSDSRRPGTLVPAEQARFARARGARTRARCGASSARRCGGTTWWRSSSARAAGAASRLCMPTRAERRVPFLGLAAALALAVTPAAARAVGRDTIIVSPSGAVRSVGAALRLARPGAVVVVRPGVYREPMIVVDKPVEIAGDGWPVLDGGGTHQIMSISADGVTVRGLVLRDVGSSDLEDRAAIKVVRASGCVIEDNRIDDAFFGIYLAAATDCRLARNVIRGTKGSESASGNGIHLWTSSRVTIEDNLVSGHRDGIYFEFVRDALVRRNLSEGNLRYGLHFMYSDDCRYVGNTFRRNLAGVAVMYTKHVEMTDNRFEDNWGSASYGLLLKEISDPLIARNRFYRNTVGLVADGAARIVAAENEFVENGWAVRLMASTYDGRFERNDFVGNTFDVASNSVEEQNVFAGNYFDSYQGYDLNRDGAGDVPHRPVRLFSVLVERNPPAMIMLRSFFAGLLDVTERVLPSLTPETLADARPAMRRLRPGGDAK